jgi:hypothetical protein
VVLTGVAGVELPFILHFKSFLLVLVHQ